MPIIFLFLDKNSPIFVQFLKETLLDNAIDRVSISLFVPEIFAVKLESCPQSHQIVDVFWPPKF